MAAPEIRIEEILREFEQNVAKVNLRNLYAEIGEIMLRSIRKNFESEGRYGGLEGGEYTGGTGRWTPLAGSTITDRQRHGYWPGKLLQRTGLLRNSISYSATDDGVKFGGNTEYLKYLHYGTKRMPARPILVVQEEDIREIELALQEYFAENL